MCCTEELSSPSLSTSSAFPMLWSRATRKPKSLSLRVCIVMGFVLCGTVMTARLTGLMQPSDDHRRAVCSLPVARPTATIGAACSSSIWLGRMEGEASLAVCSPTPPGPPGDHQLSPSQIAALREAAWSAPGFGGSTGSRRAQFLALSIAECRIHVTGPLARLRNLHNNLSLSSELRKLPQRSTGKCEYCQTKTRRYLASTAGCSARVCTIAQADALRESFFRTLKRRGVQYGVLS